MNKLVVFVFITNVFLGFSQSYAPAPGITGSTAISKDSSCFVAWATGVQVTRGYIYNSTPAGATDEAFPQGQSISFLVGAPYHFYFGLNVGKTSINTYIKKYILNQDV